MPAPSDPPSSFTLLVLGSSGGPNESSASGYLLKPFAASWEDGFVGIEGGSGVGALEVLLEEEELASELEAVRAELAIARGAKGEVPEVGRRRDGISELLRDVAWPYGYDTPILRAGYIFSFLSSYIITHGHLDHISSLVQSTGTLPSRLSPSSSSSARLCKVEPPRPSRRSVYAAKEILQEVDTAYAGVIWPELAVWGDADERKEAGGQADGTKGDVVGGAIGRDAARIEEGGATTSHSIEIPRTATPSAPASLPPKLLPAPRPSAPTLSPQSTSGKAVRKLSFVALGKRFRNLSTQADVVNKARASEGPLVPISHSVDKDREHDSLADGSRGVPNHSVQERQSSVAGHIGGLHQVVALVTRSRPARRALRIKDGVGVQLCPMPPSGSYQFLPHATPPDPAPPRISVMHMPVAHGSNSKGMFKSSAYFVRLDRGERESEGAATVVEEQEEVSPGVEFLFWGDVESRLGQTGEELNREVWREAAKRWDEGRLGAVFIECSFDGQRVPTQMYGHLQPMLLHNELGTMASFVAKTPSPGSDDQVAPFPPLRGLKVYIIHVKETFVPDPAGRTVRERVIDELREIEEAAKRERTDGALGVEFIAAERGMCIVI